VFTDKVLNQAQQGVEEWLERTKKDGEVLKKKNQSACASSVDIKSI